MVSDIRRESTAAASSRTASTASGASSDSAVSSTAATTTTSPQPQPDSDLDQPRKRTKTGCLTCRRRRIKCDESRPVCRNCTKSRRHCDGYNPRVVFQPAYYDYREVSHGGAHITFHARPLPGPTSVTYNLLDPMQQQQQQQQPLPQSQPSLLPLSTLSFDPSCYSPTAVTAQYGASMLRPRLQMPFEAMGEFQFANHQGLMPLPMSATGLPSTMLEEQVLGSDFDPIAPQFSSPPTASLSLPFLAAHAQAPEPYMRPTAAAHPGNDAPVFLPGPPLDPTQAPLQDILSDAAVQLVDDNYYDVEPDEISPPNSSPIATHDPQHAHMLTRPPIALPPSGAPPQHHDTYIHTGILDRYRIEQVASPLKNPATMRCFAHFIAVTGPSLSIFERHVRNTSMLSAKGAIPASHQGLWTYVMPSMALRNQGLLHAMLALATLHIAKIQGASLTPSMQHYAWALKRVHHFVGHPDHRHRLTTLAASMLLGYYEVMTADHMKWNTHLAGSMQLLVELDFASITYRLRRLRRAQRAMDMLPSDVLIADDDMMGAAAHVQYDSVLDADEGLLGRLVGREVRFDDERITVEAGPSLQVDLERFDALRDLFWWYCKQDAYQALISGNALLMDFAKWTDCPPRSALGLTVAGSFDHLVLLLGRMAEFNFRDRDRKRQVADEKNQTGPPPTTSPAMSASSTHQPPRQPSLSVSPTTTTHGPSFYGMAPSRGTPQMPSSYRPSQPTSSSPTPPHPRLTPTALRAATTAALAEHASIVTALDTFAHNLGPSYQPLPTSAQPSIPSPFGPTLFYRSHDIACLWAIYHLARILVARIHPSMPPAAHIAALAAARHTAHSANEIGRISAALTAPPPAAPLHPSLAAALNESCVPSFFAAVQYRDAVQRRATVQRIGGIHARTGWASSHLIANGIETAWVNAAKAGHGPPYVRVARGAVESTDPRLNGSWESPDPRVRPSEWDEADRRLVGWRPQARLHWAIGILGSEADDGEAGRSVGVGDGSVGGGGAAGRRRTE